MTTPRTSKVLVLGFDGLSPDVLEPLMDSGRAPSFARLRETGTYRRLATSNPSQSPVAWSTIATGCNAGKHGVFDFLRRNPKKYLPELAILRVNPRNLAGRRAAMFLPVLRGTPFWKITSDAGLPTTVVRWPLTLPPEPVHGRLFPGLGVPDLKANLGRYSHYTTRQVSEAEARKAKGDLIALPAGADLLETRINPPQGAKPAALTIAIDRQAAAVVVTVDGQEHRVGLRQWSDWVRVAFPLTLRKPVAGICRFYLKAVDPTLELYLSPIEADPRDPAFVLTYPDEYAAQLADAIGDYHTLGMPEDTNALGDGCIDPDGFLAQCDEVMAERERMFWHEFDRFEGGCLAFVYDTSDRVQHVFWGAHDPAAAVNPDPDFVDRYRGVVRDFYCRMDAVLGRVLDRLDDDTGLIVLSDHGFSAFRRAVHLNTWLVRNGYMTLKTPDPEATLFRNVHWRKTQAYAVGFSSIYLNLRRREGSGTVHPRNAAQLRAEIRHKLLELEDPATGERILHGVYTCDELYSGPFLDDAPDLVVGFKPGYRTSWQTALGQSPDALVEDNDESWCGDHLCDPSFVPGILFLNHPAAAPSAHLRDIAPTVLRLLGIDRPADMEGTPLLAP